RMHRGADVVDDAGREAQTEGPGTPAWRLLSLENRDRHAGARERHGRGQPAGSGPDHHDAVAHSTPNSTARSPWPAHLERRTHRRMIATDLALSAVVVASETAVMAFSLGHETRDSSRVNHLLQARRGNCGRPGVSLVHAIRLWSVSPFLSGSGPGCAHLTTDRTGGHLRSGDRPSARAHR